MHRDGAGIDPKLSPRPYLHPVRTFAGATVTEEMPDDHLHHLGAGVAVADVSGVSFWGGRTFTRDRGSVLLPNHGRQEHVAWLGDEDGLLVEELSWLSPKGAELIREERTAARIDVEAGTWALELATRLRNTSGEELVIGSQATNGRPGAGYGGFFWRAPVSETVPHCFGPGLDGEHALHGSTAEWLAMAGSSPRGEPWTLCFLQSGPVRDPWFLRAAEYPGVGTALAWDRPLPVPAGQEVRRRLVVLVSDGVLAPEAVAGLVDRFRPLLSEPGPAC
nr:PmoA family protein [Allosalinactinospora lopnorensis]